MNRLKDKREVRRSIIPSTTMCLLLFLVTGYGCGRSGDDTGSPKAPTRIVYSQREENQGEIYIGDDNGGQISGATRLTHNQADDDNPTLGANGKEIVFDSERKGNRDVYIMKADGTKERRLTNHAALDLEPVLSPDGRKIIFCSTRDGIGAVYVMNSDGTGQTRLTKAAGAVTPDFSPDGKKIAYAMQGEIYIMNADGSRPLRLTRTLRQNGPQTTQAGHAAMVREHGKPRFSPDGKKIGFMSWPITTSSKGVTTIGPSHETHSVNADGSGEAPLTGETYNTWFKRRRTHQP